MTHRRNAHRFRLVLLTLICVFARPVAAHVTGSVGLAPTLPPSVPGVDNAFPKDGQKFTFAIVGDKTGGGERNWPIFDRAMDEISELHPDFAIMVGDLIQGYTSDTDEMKRQWAEFTEHASRIRVPFFFLPGNHDISNKTMYEYWNANVGRTYYSFDYKGCHFVLLNTEEGWRKDEIQFGVEQMEWLRNDLQASRNAKHVFFFMHKPVWYHTGEALKQWETVESWIAGRPYTVFAGHFHNLSYEQRLDRPYYVLSATGAGLTPSETLELGAFHHYSMVTVDGDETHIALIRPGHVHPHDIAPRRFAESVAKIVDIRWKMPVFDVNGGSGTAEATLTNPLDKSVTVRLAFAIPDGSSWDVQPREVTYRLEPSKSATVAIRTEYRNAGSLAFPTYQYAVTYGDSPLWAGTGRLSPIVLDALTPVTQYRVVGPFDLGVAAAPASGAKPEDAIPRFFNDEGPERNVAEGGNVADGYVHGGNSWNWKVADAEASGWLDLNSIYGGDYRSAYALSYLYSPDERRTVAGILWSDDATRVWVNGETVVPYQGYNETGNTRFFIVPLRQGWNSLLVKSADFTSGWGVTIRVANPTGDLRLSRVPE
jgi:3',5'-cyclic AMP phosphodiesterase CpdA